MGSCPLFSAAISVIVFHIQKGLGNMELAAWSWLCKGETGIRDALSRYSLVVGLNAGLCGCFGILSWHLPDSCCLSYAILLMLRLGVFVRHVFPLMEIINHRGPQRNIEPDCPAAYSVLPAPFLCFLGSHLLLLPMDRHGIHLHSC